MLYKERKPHKIPDMKISILECVAVTKNKQKTYKHIHAYMHTHTHTQTQISTQIICKTQYTRASTVNRQMTKL